MKLDGVKLDPKRGAWLSPAEIEIYDWIKPVLEGVSTLHDVVIVFGAKGGGIAALLRQSRPAHLILVENDPDNERLLRMNWHGTRGVTILNRDPVEELSDGLGHYMPSIIIVNVPERMTEPKTVAALLKPHPSAELMVVVYPGFDDERMSGLDESLLLWHSNEYLRWRLLDHDGPDNVRLYDRQGQ